MPILGMVYRFCDIIAYFTKVEEVTSQWPRSFHGQFVIRRLGLAMINMHAKFEVTTLSRSRDILRKLTCSSAFANKTARRAASRQREKFLRKVGVVHFEHKCQGEGSHPPTTVGIRKPGLSRGVVCVIVLLSILIQHQHVTDTQTHRQKETRRRIIPARS